MALVAPEQPIYQQHAGESPPHRFIRIVLDYKEVAHMSARHLSLSAGFSSYYLGKHARQMREGKIVRIDPEAVRRIVTLINGIVPTNQEWPLEDAYAAAGVDNPLRIQRKQRITMNVPGAFLARCFTKWRELPSLREAARQITNGMNATKLTFNAIQYWDILARDGDIPAVVQMNPITYLILATWMGEEPVFPRRGKEFREMYKAWKKMYTKEKKEATKTND